MLSALRKLFAPTAPDRHAPATPRPVVDMLWLDGAGWPIPDWVAVGAAARPGWSEAEGDAFWSAAASQWLDRMAREWEDGYAVQESREFLLLSALPHGRARVFLRFCESVRGRILKFLPGIAAPHSGKGKHVVIVFDDQDEYYDYISHYYPEGGEYAMSSGVFLHAGYGHFVLWAGELDAMEPVVAHELTHCLVSRLPLPAWLNEGIAVNTEWRIFPRLAEPGAQEYAPHEMQSRHAAFWNADTIQQFWSGEAFHRPDEGCMLAYDLARKAVMLAASDFAAFRAFALKADAKDAGLSAELQLGFPIRNLVVAVLGEGDWAPTPARWARNGG